MIREIILHESASGNNNEVYVYVAMVIYDSPGNVLLERWCAVVYDSVPYSGIITDSDDEMKYHFNRLCPNHPKFTRAMCLC